MAEQVEDRAASGSAHFLSGGGVMGALMRSHDWAPTPFGELAGWPQSLRSAVSIMLNSRYPIALYWGSELALLYNDAWSLIPGGKHPWALGRPGRQVWPEIWETIGPLFDQVISTGEGVWQEDELLPMLRHGYLEECYYNFTFSPVRGEDGKIGGIFNAVIETTDRVLSERRLRTLSHMGERAVASLSVEAACKWATDILADNRADVPFALVYIRDGEAVRLVDFAAMKLSSTVAPEVVALGDSASPWPFMAAEKETRTIVIPTPARLDLSSAFWSEPISEVVVVPVAVAGEERPGAFLVAGANPRRRVDMTYRSFFELAAGHIGTALAIARAYEDERRRAQALAEIDHAKTTFFSNVSHEFRTPLTLMLGPLEDALAAAETPEQRERLHLAHRNALRLLRLVNALLDFSRIEAGRVQATFQFTDLAAFTADLASNFRSLIDKAGLRLILSISPLSVLAHVDRDMWEKIVLNLISNAFKFTHQGEIAVGLRERNGEAVLTVRDTGTGISSAELPKIFDRFHRVEGARGRSFEGSGIGLALVQELVKLHAGNIAVESEEGRGTTFTVIIPLSKSYLMADRVELPTDNSESATRAQAFVEEALRWLPDDTASDALLGEDAACNPLLGAFAPENRPAASGRIVLADDNADLRDYIARLLRESGYDVVTTADGEAALAFIRSDRPDLLITDVMMPRLDGFGLLQCVREDEHLRDLPVIILSARAGEEANLEGLHAGADDYLTKPFSARELLARVSANIKLARLRQQAAGAIRGSEKVLKELNATLNQRVADALSEKRLFADIVESTDASVQVVDRDYRFLAINAAAQREYERVFGARPKAGDSVLNVLALFPEEREATRKLWGRVLAGETFAETVWWGGTAHERRAYETRFSPLFDAEEHQIGAFMFGQDVTDRLREQDRLAAAEEQLRQAQKMEAVGQLTGGLAHDFNNLLAGISGSLELMQSRLHQGRHNDIERYMVAAQGATKRAAALTHRLLAFSRRQTLDPKPTDVNRLVNGMQEMIQRTVGPAIPVEVVCASGLWPALVDPPQLESALLNLCINARDSMPDGGRITIETANRWLDERAARQHDMPEGQYLAMSVTDTGTGMPPEVIARVFEPFFTTKPTGAGTGLGLSMIYGFARQSGGQVRIYSEVGKGTTVSVYLPRYNGAIADDEIVTKLMTLPQSNQSATVLVVDDEPTVRMLVTDVLDELGYTAIEAGDSAAGLKILQSNARIDLLVTDVGLPGGMNGRQMADAARTKRPNLKVLFITGYAENAAVGNGQLAPGMAVLTKPFPMDAMAARIRSLIEVDKEVRPNRSAAEGSQKT